MASTLLSSLVWWGLCPTLRTLVKTEWCIRHHVCSKCLAHHKYEIKKRYSWYKWADTIHGLQVGQRIRESKTFSWNQTVPKWPSQLLTPYSLLSLQSSPLSTTQSTKKHHKHSVSGPDLLSQAQVKLTPGQCFSQPSSQTLKYIQIFSAPWVFYLALSPSSAMPRCLCVFQGVPESLQTK